ncbi:hypothetical protein GX408_17760 [bacterium]|nr:hypothetical protein [bacterium]
MTVAEALSKIKTISYPLDGPPVCATCAETLCARIPGVVLEGKNKVPRQEQEGHFIIFTGESLDLPMQTNGKDNTFFKLNESGSGWLWSSKPYHLYTLLMDLLENRSQEDVGVYRSGLVMQRAFRWHRSTYDHFLNQGGRLIRCFDAELYLRELARLGFTHVEVNSLAFPMALESGPRGEIYPMFYTYCPALDQFVYSELNKGIYPYYYLSANLCRLKENARLALKYGLVPGLLCFEPRSVPEELFDRYPMLRGARVDHPFRSFKPRYNLTTVHPQVRAHYAEMMRKLMREVPQLGYIDIWTNDSGAGFEHTKSLYVGRNGGAYLIREWKDDELIAQRAGENILQFFKTLRDAASEINPEFRVITRMESFYGEHETVWQGLGDRIDVETNSLFAVGWQLHYSHPRYPEIKEISGGSIYQHIVDPREQAPLEDLIRRNALAHFNFSCGTFVLFEPLLGIPYPRLTFNKIKGMQEAGLDCLAHQGGIAPPNLVPFNINLEILRNFAADPAMDLQTTLIRCAKRWAGEVDYPTLLSAWELTEEAVLSFPLSIGLYATFGFSWFRLWQRPFIPNLAVISDEDRAYYEDYICTTPHNPNNIDLSKDVLFELVTPERCEADLQRMDANTWKPLDQAIALLSEKLNTQLKEIDADHVLYDQWIRLRALRCWLRTQHSVLAWVAGVHGYLRAEDAEERQRYRQMVRVMMEREIENSQELVELWRTAKVDFMAVAEQGETPLIHGKRFGDNLLKRIQLMQTHMEDEPAIESDYIEKMSARMLGRFDLNRVY